MKGRLINIFISTLSILIPLLIQGSLILSVVQEPVLTQITKAFVTLGFIVSIDDMFAEKVPKEIFVNAAKLNKHKVLKLSKDHNTNYRICIRIKKGCVGFFCCRRRKQSLCNLLLTETLNLTINLYYAIILNLQLVVYNYFIGVLCILVQMAGYFSNIMD